MTALPQLTDSTLVLDARIATLMFKRNDVRNALTSTEISADIVATVEWLNLNQEISVLILTGEGNAFSAGGNIKTMAEKSKAAPHILQKYYTDGIQRVPLVLQETDIPVIAAVNGAAVGAGFDLVNMCDIRIGSKQAQFAESFVNLGLIAGDGGGWFLQRMVGYQRAAELAFTARNIDADEALRLGILLEVTEPEALMPRAQEIAKTIAAKPPLAIRYTKRLLKLAQQQSLHNHLQACSSFQALCWKTEDHAEALAAFFEKRRGNFKGK